MTVRIGPWAGTKYFLDKMSSRDLVGAYFTHYTIMTYLVLTVVTAGLAVSRAEDAWRPLVAAAAVIPLHPLVWYLLHRHVLHGSFLYRHPQTGALWKRTHFDHLQDPNDLGVLFGALATDYARPKGFPRGDTLFNLGYTEEQSERYPWVAKLFGIEGGNAPVSRAISG